MKAVQQLTGRSSPRQAELVARAAIIAGVCGALSTVPIAPPAQAVLLLVFMLVGPGSAAMCWAELPPAVTVAAVLGVSVSVVLALAVAMAWLTIWVPIPLCLLLAAAAVASGVIRSRSLRRWGGPPSW